MTNAPDDSGDHTADEPDGTTPRCGYCGSALDDVAKMSDKDVLEHMRTEFYRDLYRNLKSGGSTHQEKAIVRGILRDNKIIADMDDGDDHDTPRRKGSPRPGASETYEFSLRTLDETEGG